MLGSCRAKSAGLRASTSIRVRSESPSRSTAWRDERPGVQLRLPLQPAIAPSARDRGRLDPQASVRDRKSTRLNSSHGYISYAVFCLKKKNKNTKNYKVSDIVNRQ